MPQNRTYETKQKKQYIVVVFAELAFIINYKNISRNITKNKKFKKTQHTHTYKFRFLGINKVVLITIKI